MAQLVFDTPWWLPAVLAGLGIYLFWTGNRRQESRVRSAGLGFLAAAVAVLVVSYFVDTALEKAVTRSKQLVRSVEQRDWATMKSILPPGVSLDVLGFAELYGNRDQLIEAARRAVDQYRVKNVRILSTSAEETETLISVTMTIISEQDATLGRPITTNWKFEWQRRGKDWTLEQIHCLKIGDMTGERAARQFPR